MKVQDIPQDVDPTYLGGQRLCYAVDEQGRYVQAHSSGWTAEQVVKGFAWQMIEKELSQLRSQVRSGHISSLRYFMRLRQMDIKLLADNMGISSWRVWWHLRPRVFRRLPPSWLRHYGEVLDVPMALLQTYRGDDGA